MGRPGASPGSSAMGVQGRGANMGGGGGGRGGGVNTGGSSSSIDRKTSAARLLYQMPPHSDAPHVFLRCNYCSSSLPSDPLQQQQASFFRKQRPLINCCANCKKPLPRCYVCLLYMGLGDPPCLSCEYVPSELALAEMLCVQSVSLLNHPLTS